MTMVVSCEGPATRERPGPLPPLHGSSDMQDGTERWKPVNFLNGIMLQLIRPAADRDLAGIVEHADVYVLMEGNGGEWELHSVHRNREDATAAASRADDPSSLMLVPLDFGVEWDGRGVGRAWRRAMEGVLCLTLRRSRSGTPFVPDPAMEHAPIVYEETHPVDLFGGNRMSERPA